MRKNKIQKQCLFCTYTGSLTKEHINPDWLAPYLEKKFVFTNHSVTMGAEEKIGLINRTGDPLSRKLRILCETCNGIIMSSLQSKAKNILRPLVLGDWSQFTKDDHALLAAWITMTTMVVEQADPATAASSEIERFNFRKTMVAPDNWTIWVARYDGIQSGVWNHVGWALVREGEKPPEKPNAQTTGFILGKFFF